MTEKENDFRQIRKVKKTLRQIEHLKLLNRELNDDEKLKVERRPILRQMLLEFNTKYAGERLDTSDDNTFNTTDNSLYNPNSSFDYQESVETQSVSVMPKEHTKNIEQITDKFTKLTISEEVEQKQAITQSEEKIVEKKQSQNTAKATISAADKKANDKENNKPKRGEQTFLAVTFKNETVQEAHDELITCLDVSTENSLIVTGSRDTTIRLWNYESGKMVHSLGGHQGAITCVRFWNFNTYKNSLDYIVNNLPKDEQDHDDAEELLEKLNEISSEYPLVISSSLDCTFRIWTISYDNYTCLKQVYLYNRVNWFSIEDDAFVFALDGGKIEYWKRAIKQSNLKAFDDFEMVVSTQVSQNKVYALAHTGSFKVFTIMNSNDEILKLANQNDISTLPKNNDKQSYKSFAIVDNDRVILMNNQSYVVMQNLATNQCEQIACTTKYEDITSAILKYDNLVYIASYSIDNGISSVNAFSTSPQLKYEYSIEDNSHLNENSISKLCCKSLNDKQSILVTVSNRNLTYWNISNESRYKSRSKRFKLYDYTNQKNVDNDEATYTDSEDNSEKSEDSDEEESQPTKSGSYCSIQ